MNDLISVIIPCKNGENYLAEALDGIIKQKMNVEIIVVDDASTDKTSDIALKYGCKVIHQGISKGPVVAKNVGLGVAQGQYILFHDHDDVMRDGALATLYSTLTKDSELSAVMGKVQDFLSPGVFLSDMTIQKDAYWGLFTGAFLLKKAVFDKIGMFSENLTAGEIMELMQKMDVASLKVEKIDFVTTNRRIHNCNFGRTNRDKEFKDYARILRARMHN